MGRVVLICSALFIVMSIALYFIMIKVMPPEINTIEGGKDLIKEELHKLYSLAHVNGV